MSSRKPEPDPDAELRELRELVREAHGAIRDLDRLLAEYRRILRDGAEEARQAAFKAGDAEVRRLGAHLEAEARKTGDEIEAAIGRSRQWIVDHLMVSSLETTGDGRIRITFGAGEGTHEMIPATGRDLALMMRASGRGPVLRNPAKSQCPYCGRANDAVTPVEGGTVPDAGSVSMCASCGEIGIFTGDGYDVREATDAERAGLINDPNVKAMRAWRRGPTS